ncbi:DEKNAAC101942 [Brettanomyces naardenensis]|uniref:chitin synthase n=1 Tax=Brettanomyces naardenensis TaxID=13370 RepID=A0A448YJF4_BRENA|nr:DEKNAAC101942 [Brettanomyces naardenensis]
MGIKDANGNPRNPWHEVLEDSDYRDSMYSWEEQNGAGQSRQRQRLQPPRPYIGDDSPDNNVLQVPHGGGGSRHVDFRMPSRSYAPERYTVSSRSSNSGSPIRQSHLQYSNPPSPSRPLLQNIQLDRAPSIQSSSRIPDIPDLDVDSSATNVSSMIGKGALGADPTGSDVFCGYDFDNDDAIRHGTGDHTKDALPDDFEPFPEIDNSFYPINPPRNLYDPFEMEEYYKDEGSIGEDHTISGEGYGDDKVDEFMQMYQNEEEQPDLAARQVRMVNGNLVLDCPVSDVLLSKYKIPLTERDREFLFMRFQACTAEPYDFSKKNFSLRQKFYTQPRQTEMLVVITMYNESEVLLARTLKAVFRNIRYLYSLKHSSTWGKDAWQKVVVCIVSDGRRKINPKSKALLAAMGVYQEGFAKNKINDDKVVSHIYEYTTMVGISKIYKDRVTLTTENQIPIQMVFCLKERNQQKINSHAWAFQAFAEVLQPNIVTLVDVGTEPQGKSLYRLWKAFKDPRVAGACGEIKASLGRHDKLLLNPLVAAQNFEYKTSNILDKPMESVFGFITVLPGAFSAYRYRALLGAPLDKYLKGQDLRKSNDDGIFNANMYLAEDRILCFELIAKKNCSWILKYVSSASAYTDVPEQLHELISQRRRWLNGSFFSAIYSVFQFYRTWHTSHSTGRKILLHIEFIYQFLNLLVSWFSLGSYYLVFRILAVYLAEKDSHFAPGNVLSVIFLWIYLASLATTFVLSLGNKPKGTKKFYLAIVSFFAILMVYMIFAALYMGIQAIQDILREHAKDFKFKYLFTETRFRDLIVATSSTYVLYLVGFIIYLQPWHMFNSFIQYLLLSPSYTNVFNVYAFCNIHDISWGTKEEEGLNDLGVAKTTTNVVDGELEIVIPTTKQQIDQAYRKIMDELTTKVEKDEGPKLSIDEQTAFYYANMRSITVLVWIFTNFVLVAVVTNTGGLEQFSSVVSDPLPLNKTFVFLTVILWIVAFMALFRFVGSTTYLILKFIEFVRLRIFRRKYGVRGAQYDA